MIKKQKKTKKNVISRYHTFVYNSVVCKQINKLTVHLRFWYKQKNLVNKSGYFFYIHVHHYLHY